MQCKWARRVGDVVAVRLVGSRFTPTGGYVRVTYASDEIDAVAAYCAELDRCYLIPSDLVAGRNQLHLRLAPTKNGQQAGLHWAEPYELAGIVSARHNAHAERIEAEPDLPCREGTVVVSAHEFRDRFGYFMEFAREGGEVEITRFGRSVARLVPTDDRRPR